MTQTDSFASNEDEEERITCLVEQGFTPSLARSVLLARSKECLPLTIWLVDNSSSMSIRDGRKLVETSRQDDVRVVDCTRWEELQETVNYHAQLSALLEAPTKFVFLNKPRSSSGISNCPQEMSIAERGSEFVHEDLRTFQINISSISPEGVTPLTMHLRHIYHSIQHFQEKIVLVLATDGRPTDNHGYATAEVDKEFELALCEIQSKAWIVIRLCTNDDNVLRYYQRLDEQMELSLEVLDDYFDEAKEVHKHNPWLTYALCLHRCREMGLSYSALHRWLDWLDERSLTKTEIYEVLQFLGVGASIRTSNSLDEGTEWSEYCETVQRNQETLGPQRNELTGSSVPAFMPWNPIRRRATMWIDIPRLRRHGTKAWVQFDERTLVAAAIIFALVAMYISS